MEPPRRSKRLQNRALHAAESGRFPPTVGPFHDGETCGACLLPLIDPDAVGQTVEAAGIGRIQVGSWSCRKEHDHGQHAGSGFILVD